MSVGHRRLFTSHSGHVRFTPKADISSPSGNCRHRRTLAPGEVSQEGAMPTQLRLFSTNGSENFSRLEKEVNDWLAGKGDSIQPVNSQTATCAITNVGGAKQSQAVIVALWYLDPPVRERGHH